MAEAWLHLIYLTAGGVAFRPKLQPLVYDILPLEEDAGKRCSECAGMSKVYCYCYPA